LGGQLQGLNTAYLEKSLLMAIRSSGEGPLVVDNGGRRFPGSLAERNAAALRTGADAWIRVEIAGTQDAPLLLVLSYDVVYKRFVINRSLRRDAPFSLMDLPRETWDDLVPLVVQGYPPVPPDDLATGPPASAALTVRALPGTRITGLTAAPLTVGESGEAVVELPSPASYSFRASLPGRFPSSRSIYLDGQTEVTLVQEKSPRVSLDLTLSDGFYPGASVALLMSPLPIFVRLAVTSFRVGLTPFSDQGLFTSLPLSRTAILLGYSFGEEDSYWRFTTAVGPVIRLTWPPGGSLTQDALAPLGLQFAAGVDIPLGPAARFFLEYTPTLYATPYPKLFKASFAKSEPPGYAFFSSSALSTLSFRYGVRWLL
jgi:hypothetical protein